MKKIIIDVDGYRCTVCGHKWLPVLILEHIVCPRCGAVWMNKEKHDEEHGLDSQHRNAKPNND